MKTICVTGASGCLGQALLQELQGKYRTKALFRAESEISRYWSNHGCEISFGSLSDEASLSAFVQETDAVFHCAATIAKDDYDRSYEVNVLGTERLAQQAAKAKCSLFVHVSSISVYAATCTPDNVCTEETVPQNIAELNHYSHTKYLSELTVQQTCQEHALAYLILRPTNVYGPGSKPWLLNICELVRRMPVLLGAVALDFVHVQDLAKAMVQAVETPRAYNQTFNLGHEMLPLREFCATLAELLEIRHRFLPGAIDRILSHAIDSLYRHATGRRTSYSFVRPVYYPHAKAKALFNYAPEIRIAPGLRQTVFWLRQRQQETQLQFPRPYLQKPKKFEPLETIPISSEAMLVEAVLKARHQRIPIRPRGSMGSKSKNFHTAGISLDLSALDKLIRLDGDLVTVQAGMKLSQLFQILKANGLALPSLGEWAGATVAGAVSTGTHGGSVHYGSMSSSLHAMKLVLADGTTRQIDRDDELFDYVGISFGIFGVISEVTLRCVPHFRLHLEKEIVSLAKFIHSLDELNRQWRYLSAIWIPSAGNVLLYRAHPTAANKTRGQRDQRFNLKNDSICMMCNRLPLPGLFPEKLFQDPIVGDWDKILAPIGEDGRVSGYLKDNFKRPLEVEIAVPLADAACLLLELDKLFQAHRAFPSLPVGVRCGGKEDFLLSPCYKRDSLWLAFFIQNNARLLVQISNLVMNYHCRAHWGKSMWLPEEYLKTQYERWSDILETKRQLDPEAVFSNAFTRRFGI